MWHLLDASHRRTLHKNKLKKFDSEKREKGPGERRIEAKKWERVVLSNQAGMHAQVMRDGNCLRVSGVLHVGKLPQTTRRQLIAAVKGKRGGENAMAMVRREARQRGSDMRRWKKSTWELYETGWKTSVAANARHQNLACASAHY